MTVITPYVKPNVSDPWCIKNISELCQNAMILVNYIKCQCTINNLPLVMNSLTLGLKVVILAKHYPTEVIVISSHNNF